MMARYAEERQTVTNMDLGKRADFHQKLVSKGSSSVELNV